MPDLVPEAAYMRGDHEPNVASDYRYGDAAPCLATASTDLACARGLFSSYDQPSSCSLASPIPKW